MKNYTDLKVWRSAMLLAVNTYAATSTLPTTQRYGLTAQMQRAAVSIPSNIAEGNARGSDREFLRFARIAYGSACELHTQASLAERIGIGDTDQFASLASEVVQVQRLIGGLIRRLTADT